MAKRSSPLGKLQFTKTSKGRRLPTVFSHSEALAVLAHLDGSHRLAASQMYGAGLRVMEAVRLRVQDVDFGESCLIIREAKGDKWRRTLLPRSLTHQHNHDLHPCGLHPRAWRQ